MIQRFWPSSPAWRTVSDGTGADSDNSSTSRSPTTRLKAPTVQAVASEPSTAWNGRSPAVKVTGLP